MLYGLLITLYIFVCLFLVLIILVQKGKGSTGLGGLGGGTQMLFGGSGGQDIFQKITWILGAIFIFGSLMLALMRSTQNRTLTINTRAHTQQTAPQMPESSPQK
jgi:preprotein translocase subunit SecG